MRTPQLRATRMAHRQTCAVSALLVMIQHMLLCHTTNLTSTNPKSPDHRGDGRKSQQQYMMGGPWAAMRFEFLRKTNSTPQQQLPVHSFCAPVTCSRHTQCPSRTQSNQASGSTATASQAACWLAAAVALAGCSWDNNGHNQGYNQVSC